jgi:flagellar hook-length control protein FliK
MMTQASGATGAAVLVGASADGGTSAGAELQGTPGGANAVPFAHALQALAAGTDTAGARPAAAGTGTAVPADGAEALPKDLLLALFAAAAAAPEADGTPRKTGQAGIDDTRAAAAARDLQEVPADPGAALLAAVLQWLQQQHPAARVAGGADDSSANGREAATDAVKTPAVAAAASVPIADSLAANASAGRNNGAGAAGASLAAAPTATLSGQLASQRDGDGRATGDDPPPASTTVADNAPGSGVGAGMDMAAALRAASNATAVQVERSVTVPVHERHWPTALAAQVLVLSNDKVQGATLRLSPEHLGPVEVRIDMHEANVNVSFTAAHTETRAALEQAMPQLRAVLAGAGLSLGQATVQQQARRESQNPNLPARIGGAADEQIEAPAALARALGLIDEYV